MPESSDPLQGIWLRTVDEGVLLPVQAHAGARSNGIGGVHDGRLRVLVTQAPERGKANRELIRVLADGLDLKRSALELRSGETSPRKQFLVRGVREPELRARLRECLTEKH